MVEIMASGLQSLRFGENDGVKDPVQPAFPVWVTRRCVQIKSQLPKNYLK
jgi:hypothetical protein